MVEVGGTSKSWFENPGHIVQEKLFVNRIRVPVDSQKSCHLFIYYGVETFSSRRSPRRLTY